MKLQMQLIIIPVPILSELKLLQNIIFIFGLDKELKKYNYNFRMNSNFMLDTFNKGNHEWSYSRFGSNGKWRWTDDIYSQCWIQEKKSNLTLTFYVVTLQLQHTQHFFYEVQRTQHCKRCFRPSSFSWLNCQPIIRLQNQKL